MTLIRKNWISILGCADPADLESAARQIPYETDYTTIIGPETGMLMVQARRDGTGPRFNLGEITVTRCVVEVNGRYPGTGWVIGANHRHAELAALFDGFLQDPNLHPLLMKKFIPDLLEKQRTAEEALLKEASDTRVEFFTLKRDK